MQMDLRLPRQSVGGTVAILIAMAPRLMTLIAVMGTNARLRVHRLIFELMLESKQAPGTDDSN